MHSNSPGSAPTYPLSMLFSAPLPVADVASHVLDSSIEGHRHEFFEIAFVLDGCGQHLTEDEEIELRRGDVIVLTPGTWHGYASCDELEVVNCCVPPSVARHELGWTRADPFLGGLLWPLAGDGARHVRLDEEQLTGTLALLDELSGTASGGVRAHAETVGRLTVLLARLTEALGVADFSPAVRPVPEPVLAGIRLLEGSPAHQWRLAELASAVHVTTSYLTRLFTAHTGVPPIAYLGRYRAELAAMLLRRTDADVGAIGARVGWDDPNYFARRFRQHFGVNPTSYRAHVGQWHEELRPHAPNP